MKNKESTDPGFWVRLESFELLGSGSQFRVKDPASPFQFLRFWVPCAQFMTLNPGYHLYILGSCISQVPRLTSEIRVLLQRSQIPGASFIFWGPVTGISRPTRQSQVPVKGLEFPFFLHAKAVVNLISVITELPFHVE